MSEMSQMGQGKAPYNVAKRSLIRPIHRERRSGMGDGIGQGYASVLADGRELVTAASCYVMGSQEEDAVRYAFWQVENEILAAGGELLGVRPTFLFPSSQEEALAASWGKALDEMCGERNCQVSGVGAAGSQKVEAPVCMLTGCGMLRRRNAAAQPGWDIVAAGHAGMEGVAMLTRGKKEELKKRFSYDFIRQAEDFFLELSIRRMTDASVLAQPVLVHALGEGGVLAGLWNLAERTGLGLCVRLRDIPIRQETVEISEFFEINPYQMMAGGMAFFVTEKGEETARTLRRMKIPAQVIGTMTNKKERVVENGEERRFLDRPAADEMYRTGILV